MNQALPSTSVPDADEAFLARLALALEQVAAHPSQAREAVIDRYLAERPDLADEVRELAGLDARLASTSVPAHQLKYGDRLGEFRIVRLIAAGGMGEVYEAEQESLVVFRPHESVERRRRVAIKVIRQGQLADDMRARFLREQAVLARLHQTNVVPVHTAGRAEGIDYFVMPYIQGAALNHVLDATCRETKRRHNTPTLGAVASRIAPDAHPAAAPSAATLFPADFQALEQAPATPRRQLGGQRVNLSVAYYRSVAAVMAEAAEAVEHAHDAGIVHRDLKPSNIMVDAAGHCWIIDFGLAGAMPKRSAAWDDAPTQLPGQQPREVHHTTPGLLGTVPYLAPEQLDGRADARSDVYGLGATLYELCTWRPPFAPLDAATIDRIRSQAVRPPRELAPGLPRDLAAICTKALARSPEHRYPSARDLADDLRRWLNHEPTEARPARAPRRAWLWARRNPGWAASLLVFCMAIGLLVYSQVRLARTSRDKSLRAEIKRIHSSPKSVSGDRGSWFDEVRLYATEAASIGVDTELRTLAAASLAGVDARLQQRWRIVAAKLAFDRDGKRLLMGGREDQPARFWDGGLREPVASKVVGEGPVAFSPQGEPWQLVAAGEGKFVLFEVTSRQVVREFNLPEKDWGAAAWDLSGDGRLAAACAVSPDGTKGVAAVWSCESGELVLRLDVVASALALGSEGAVLAVGDRAGNVSVWSLPDGQAVASRLSSDRAAIQALAIGRDPRTPGDGKPRWLVAAGDDAGTITVWDSDGRVRSLGRGSAHHIHSLEFSPDGMTLGSVGRGDVKLWDTATGRLVLSIPESNWLNDLAFSPDGQSIAVSSSRAFDDAGQVSIWKLDDGRGIQTFRGLGQPISTAIFSPDQRYVAAIAHDSRVGLWDRQTERLLQVFEMPKIAWVDNAVLMFSPDGQRLACSGSSLREGFARLWDVADGREVGAWSFSPGLNHSLAFPKPEQALLFQVETRPGDHLPDSSQPARDKPRVGRLYDLRPGEPAARRRWEVTEFPWNIEFPQMPEDGRFLALKGLAGQNQPEHHVVKVFDAATGATLWAGPKDASDPRRGTSGLMLDRTGQYLTDEKQYVVELPGGKLLDKPPPGATDAHRWRPDMPYFIDNATSTRLSLVPRGGQPVLDLDRDQRGSCVRKQLSPGGDRFVWGTIEGTVFVCDFAEVRRRLTEMGLGW